MDEVLELAWREYRRRELEAFELEALLVREPHRSSEIIDAALTRLETKGGH